MPVWVQEVESKQVSVVELVEVESMQVQVVSVRVQAAESKQVSVVEVVVELVEVVEWAASMLVEMMVVKWRVLRVQRVWVLDPTMTHYLRHRR